jgi:hypothetical protein
VECVKDKYIYKGKDISFLIIRKIEQVVYIIAEEENTGFEDAYSKFLTSQTYKSCKIQVPLCGLKMRNLLLESITGYRGKHIHMSPLYLVYP